VNLRVAARIALAFVGLGVVAYLVHEAGPARVAQVLMQAWRWLPLIVLLEATQAFGDFVGLRLILRERWAQVPARTWVRSGSVAYAMMVLLPAGRAAGEVTRATLLSSHIGTPRAATASTLLQAAYLSANGVLSFAACMVVSATYGSRSLLAVLLAGNVVVQGMICTGLILTLRNKPLGDWLERMRLRIFPRARPSLPIEPEARRTLPFATAGSCILSRSVQLVQYGIVLRAVGGVATVRNAFVAHGIHLVGATIGDFVPNQLGVVDSAYRAFARDLGFADAPARALSIAFVVRISQLIFASICVLATALTRHQAERRGSAPARVDAHS
jgi:hypothetical protein